jgi:hypothetical protein
VRPNTGNFAKRKQVFRIDYSKAVDEGVSFIADDNCSQLLVLIFVVSGWTPANSVYSILSRKTKSTMPATEIAGRSTLHPCDNLPHSILFQKESIEFVILDWPKFFCFN